MDTKMLSYTPKYYTIEYEHKGKRFTVTLDKVASCGIPKDAVIVDIVYTIADTPLPQTTEDCVQTVGGWWVKQNQEKGINPMYTDECTHKMGFKAKAVVANAQIINAAPVEATQRDYVIERIKAIVEKHDEALRVQFNMDTVYPNTFLELEALIKAGNYTVLDKAKDVDAHLYNVLYGVHFGKPKDEIGYNVARDALKTAVQKALDGASLRPLDQLEVVIDDFEAWTL